MIGFILIGAAFTYAGLVVFLSAVSVGFMPIGYKLGGALAELNPYVLCGAAFLLGLLVVLAEPAVHVLKKQVEEITDGTVTGRSMLLALSIGVGISVGIAMLRVLTGIPVLPILIFGYVLSLVITFFVPPIYTGIAFDSGGVASGPMTATFLLPFAMGASLAIGGSVVKDAFGVVAMVAMTPLIAIQLLGLVYKIKQSKSAKVVEMPIGEACEPIEIECQPAPIEEQVDNADEDIIDF